MARELITKCDKCGEAGDDVRTYTLRQDGLTWEADLDDRHSQSVTLAEMMKIGRLIESNRRGNSTSSLERRIRGIPLDHPPE